MGRQITVPLLRWLASLTLCSAYLLSIATVSATQIDAEKERQRAEKLFAEAEQLSQHRNTQDLKDAIAKLEEVAKIRQRLGDRFDVATTMASLGRNYERLDDKQKALIHYRQSLQMFQTTINRSWDGLFQNMSLLYAALGGKQEALNYLSDALPLVRALHNHRLEAVLLTGIAKIYDDLGDTNSALKTYQETLATYQSLGKNSTETLTLTDIANADLTLPQRKKAITYLMQALPVVRAVGDRSIEATILCAIGYVYTSLDEKQKALDYFQQGLPIFHALGDQNSEAYMLSFIGAFYASSGDNEYALDYYERALLLFHTIHDRKAEGYTQLRIGNLYLHSGDRSKTLKYLADALTIFQETQETYGEASTLNALGRAKFSLGEKQKAIDLFRQALSIWRTIGYRDGEAGALSYLGFVQESLGEAQSAYDFHYQALQLFQTLGNSSGEAIAHLGLARALSLQNRLKEARAEMEEALNLVESSRTKIASEDLRASYFASQLEFYKFYINLLMRLHESSPSQGADVIAFQVSERARARSLLEVLVDSHADIRMGADPLLLEREKNLQTELNLKEQFRRGLLNRREALERIATADKEIRSLTAEYRDVMTQIRLKSPHYISLTQPQPLTLKEVQQQILDEDTLLLEYTLSEQRSYVWVVSSTTIRSFVLPGQAKIEATARRFYDLLSNPTLQAARREKRGTTSKGDSSASTAQDVAAQLSQMLLEPIVAILGNKRLLIVTEGILQYIPFAALLTPDFSKEKGNHDSSSKTLGANSLPTRASANPLIVNHEIIYLPSASVLAILRRENLGRKIAEKTIAVLADPVFSSDDSRVKKTDIENKEKTVSRNTSVASSELRLPRLLGSRQEATDILALVPEDQRRLALDFAANRSIATSPELTQYAIVHFATHAILDSVHPELSGIALSLVDERGKPQDGFLRLYEIYNLHLPVELVTLSACQTGLGREVRGEGLIGLTRGFMYAGAQRIVASLWKVDDEATAKLMKIFYQKIIKDQMRPAAALRAAQLEMWQQQRWKEPYFWASFLIQGEWK